MQPGAHVWGLPLCSPHTCSLSLSKAPTFVACYCAVRPTRTQPTAHMCGLPPLCSPHTRSLLLGQPPTCVTCHCAVPTHAAASHLARRPHVWLATVQSLHKKRLTQPTAHMCGLPLLCSPHTRSLLLNEPPTCVARHCAVQTQEASYSANRPHVWPAINGRPHMCGDCTILCRPHTCSLPLNQPPTCSRACTGATVQFVVTRRVG